MAHQPTSVVRLHQGPWTLFLSAGSEELLGANGVLEPEKLMALQGGFMMRSVPGRGTARFEMKSPGGGTQFVYLKRYEREYLGGRQRWLRRLGWPSAQDEALHEWNAIWSLRAAGFSTAWPIAAGQFREAGVVTRSFLLTAEIGGGIAAHDFLRRLANPARRALIVEIARLTQRFMQAGFAHRDYYLSHIFVVQSPGRAHDRELYLIDLQRVFKPRFMRERWLAKDLGALAYTAQLSGASRADLLAFYRACFETQHIRERDKPLIRRVLRRVQALHSRGPKYDVIWDQPGLRPPNV